MMTCRSLCWVFIVGFVNIIIMFHWCTIKSHMLDFIHILTCHSKHKTCQVPLKAWVKETVQCCWWPPLTHRQQKGVSSFILLWHDRSCLCIFLLPCIWFKLIDNWVCFDYSLLWFLFCFSCGKRLRHNRRQLCS